MTTDNNNKNDSLISKTLFFSSIKDDEFDYALPLKNSINKFCSPQRAEASPNLFEYLCYKIVQKQIANNNINQETAIISEKFLSSKNCKINIIKSNSIQKKFIFIPIRHSVTHKWNAIIFVHLEKQIIQYMKKSKDEPIVAKIISSNVNSEEDDFILNTTMDKIESAFNFTSPEDIQFEVDSINISDQPNTSIFLLNFIEGLITQENNTDSIMNYIMKLYDESSNSNIIGSNNYFISFNKENEIFNELIPNYIKELKYYIKVKNNLDLDQMKIKDDTIFDMVHFEGEEEDDLDSEEEALRIIAKENEEARKQMEEQELFFSNKINGNFKFGIEDVNVQHKNILGLIQEAENESDEDSTHKSGANINNNHSLIKKNDDIDITENENENKSNLDNEQNNDYNVDDIKSNNELKLSITNGKLVDSDLDLEKEKNENKDEESIELISNNVFVSNEEKNYYNNKINNDKPFKINELYNLDQENDIELNDENIIKEKIIEKNDIINDNKNEKENGNYNKKDNIDELQNDDNKENKNYEHNKNKEVDKDKNNNLILDNKIKDIKQIKDNININKNKISPNNMKKLANNKNNINTPFINYELNSYLKKSKEYNNYISDKTNSSKPLSKNIVEFNQNLKKMKNDLINNFRKENLKIINNNKNINRSSFNLKDNTLENAFLNIDLKNDNILHKSLNNIKNNNNNTLELSSDSSNSFSCVNRSGNLYNNCHIFISKTSKEKIKSKISNNVQKNINLYENDNKANILKNNEQIDKIKGANQNQLNNINVNVNNLNNIKIRDNNKIKSKIINSNINLNNNFINKNYSNNGMDNFEIIEDDNFVENENNNIIYESNNKHYIKNMNAKLINNSNYNKYNNNNIEGEFNKYNKSSPALLNENQNLNDNNDINHNLNQFKKNTIIINETSNNNTFINFIEIKNNFQSNKMSDEMINNSQKNINTNINILPNNNIQNLNSNNTNINIIKTNTIPRDDNEEMTHIPEDGIINTISTTFSPNKTLSIMNNQENLSKNVSTFKSNSYYQSINNNSSNLIKERIKSSLNTNSEHIQDKEDESNTYINMNNTYKTTNSNKLKTFSDNNSKNSKLTLLDNFIYGNLNSENDNKFLNDNINIGNQDISNEDIINNSNSKVRRMNRSENNLDLNNNNYSDYIENSGNKISKENGSVILRRTTKKMKHRGGPDKTKNSTHSQNDDILRDYDLSNECALNLSNDLKCGCTGNVGENCNIF